LGGNSLSDLLVFGKRAGKAAAEHSKSIESGSLDAAQLQDAEREMLAPFERTDGEFPYEIHRDLQDFMHSLVGIFRTEEDLHKALGELEKLQPRLQRMRADGSRTFNPGWHLTHDLRSMVLISEAVTRSALARRESRGAHSRIDYPNFDDTWGKQNNIIVKRGDQMMLEQRPVDEMPAELKAILAEEK
jgi:succinate dehydrogenase / fumarate reductase flavoprotein subunit